MLDAFFDPQSVAVIGASRSPGKLGFTVLSNIVQHGYRGAIYPINPRAREILGLRSYPSVLDVPGPVDLAVFLIPSVRVASALVECGEKGVRGAIVIAAGFREVGGEGWQREREIVDIAHRYGMRLLGPNCLGLIDTVAGLNASFAAGMPRRGRIAFLSQSGALCTAILDMALAERVGFSRFVSLGNKADVDEVTLIRAWDRDLYTGVILAYVEGIERGREFLEVARQVTRRKPIIAIKAGSTAAGSRAVSSHTGTLAGSEAAYEAAFRQSGVIRVRSVQELFDYAVAFGRQPPLVNGRIAIVTNAGGPGIMATDACERAGLQLAPLSQETMEVLRCALPAAASVLNPIDLLGDAPAACYGLALDAALADPQVGGVLVILTPQAMTEVEATARIVGAAAQATDKPVLACFMGRASVESGVLILEESGVPNYPVPERAVAAFAAMARQQAWSEEPPEQLESFALDRASISAVLDRVRADGRVAVGDLEGRQILAACGIPVPRTFLARTPAEAVLYAEEIGFPVAVKLSSPDILHKTDLGGVQLGVSDPQAVREAFEQMTYRAQRLMPDAEVWGCLVQERVAGGQETVVIMNRDPHFGPLLAFRLGSVDIQALRDQAYRIAPFDRRAAREMIREARAHDLMSGAGGRAPADVEALVDALLRLGQVATDYPEIAEFEADPLVVQGQGQGLVGVDMRLVLAP